MWLTALVTSIALLCVFAFLQIRHRFGRKWRAKRVGVVAIAMAMNISFLIAVDDSLGNAGVSFIITVIESFALAGMIWLCLPSRLRLWFQYHFSNILFKGIAGKYKRKRRQLRLWTEYE